MRMLEYFDNFKLYVGKKDSIITFFGTLGEIIKSRVNLCYQDLVYGNMLGGGKCFREAWCSFEYGGYDYDLNVFPSSEGDKFGAVIYSIDDYGDTDTSVFAPASFVSVDIRTKFPGKNSTKILEVE